MAGITGSNKQPVPFTDSSQHASSPGRRAHCYAELDVSAPAVVETIASAHGTEG